MILDTHWDSIEDDYFDKAGFVYKIINNVNGRAYIGRKYFYKKSGKALIESDWKDYTSSSEELNKDLKRIGKDKFSFIVLAVCKDRIETNYLEVAMQINANVLTETLQDGSLAFYNKNIMSKYFQTKEPGTEEHKARCENISKALKKLYSNGYTHPMKGKTHPNKGKSLPQTAPKTNNAGTLWYTNGEVNVVVRKNQEIPDGFVRGLTKRKKYVNSVIQNAKNEYEKNPKKCLICGKPITFRSKRNDCCGKVCQGKLQSNFLKEQISKGKHPFIK